MRSNNRITKLLIHTDIQLFTLHLISIYFHLNISLLNIDNIKDDIPCATVEEVYNYIVKDLKAAEDCNLPEKYPDGSKHIGDANVYVSAQAVKSTLASVYM